MKTQREDAVVVADRLGETRAEARQTIWRIVVQCGAEQTQRWLQQAIDCAHDGGLWYCDLHGDCQLRTLGGIFFTLVRNDLRQTRHDAYAAIFQGRRARGRERFAHAGPGVTGVTWETRHTLRAQLLMAHPQQNGALVVHEHNPARVRVRLTGRPQGEPVVTGNLVTIMVAASARPKNAPKGAPLPPETQVDRYLVHLTLRRWTLLANALGQAQDDYLIIEGEQVLDTDLVSMHVYATQSTTRNLAQARKDAPAV